ncbi:MAG: hypothetical protein HQK83_06765 [Fibrobacteria bacterium]|nr:hypothetical protein [Fibrobacteria bacterium]
MIIKYTLITFSLLGLLACANFPEKFENIIEEGKIRPIAIVLDPPEAAPGDTVNVTLYMHDAGKPYSIDWTLALDFNITNYGQLGSSGSVLNLDSMRIDADGYMDNPLRFRFVVPVGDKNPMLHSSLIPEIAIPSSELDNDMKGALESMDVPIGEKGVAGKDVVELLDNTEDIPEEFSPMVDGLISLIVLNARVVSGDFTLDIEKKLTVRYSNRLVVENGTTNVNVNPTLDSIGIISVAKKDMEIPEDIHKYDSDTVYFKTNAFNQDSGAVVDTFVIKKDYSYFLIADSAGAAQKYVTPNGTVLKEQLFYHWYYTNLDETSSDWEKLINIGSDESDASLSVVSMTPPTDKSMNNFRIRVSVSDWRPEWALLCSDGIGYLDVRGYFKYED